MSWDDSTDFAELLDLLNTYAQNDGDPVGAANRVRAANPVTAADPVQVTDSGRPAADSVQSANGVRAADPVQESDPVQVANPVPLEADSTHSSNGIQAANPLQEKLHQILAHDDDHQREPADWIDVKPNAVPLPANLYDVDHNNRFAAHIIQGKAKMRARLRDGE
jgi:hypothetical protein